MIDDTSFSATSETRSYPKITPEQTTYGIDHNGAIANHNS